MENDKKVKDMMIDIFDYPHIPYWFSIRQAIGIIKTSLIGSDKCFYPLALLIFDEEYKLMGYITPKDILKGLEPRFLSTKSRAQGIPEAKESLAVMWAEMFSTDCKVQAEKEVSEIMVKVKSTVKTEDPIVKAAYLMINEDSPLLPVIQDNKIVGIIRLIEVFDELSKCVSEG